MGHDVIDFCKEVLNRGRSVAKVNDTMIVLIPKIKEPVGMTRYRSISLCQVIYKIISKVHSNRFKPLLFVCISDNQSAFVKGQMIHDNILIAHELFHYFQSSKNGPNKVFAVKLDMSKAYDRVEWNFIEKVMLKLGFSSAWVSKIMGYVYSIKCVAKCNLRLIEDIISARGLR